MVCTLMEKDTGLGHGLHSHGKGYGIGSWSALSWKRIWDWVMVCTLMKKDRGLGHGLHFRGKGYGIGSWSAVLVKRLWGWIMVNSQREDWIIVNSLIENRRRIRIWFPVWVIVYSLSDNT